MIAMPTNSNSNKAVYWILTMPHHTFTPYLPPGCSFIKGQLELGEGGFLHWQVMVGFTGQVRLAAVRKTFGPIHAEPTRSKAAEDYVWKDETCVQGTKFVLGVKRMDRSSPKDWANILQAAKSGDFDKIPADVFIRSYQSITKIAVAHATPIGIERSCRVFWGATGSGKTKLAWEEAGVEAYPKDPMSKFWDGYRGQENVIVDEFRGSIAISHLLRWLDRYPVLVEVKGSSVVFRASKIWITSNIHPREWYPMLDSKTYDALERRMEIIEMN